jgi:hypothetical protein
MTQIEEEDCGFLGMNFSLEISRRQHQLSDWCTRLSSFGHLLNLRHLWFISSRGLWGATALRLFFPDRSRGGNHIRQRLLHFGPTASLESTIRVHPQLLPW